MSWNAPPTFIAGTVCTAGNLNILAGDLTALTSSIPLFGKSGFVTGSPPATITPGQYLVQAGAAAGITSGFNFTQAFPAAFPNGVLAILVTPVVIGGASSATWTFNVTVASASSFTLTTSLSATSVSFSWFAIGF